MQSPRAQRALFPIERVQPHQSGSEHRRRRWFAAGWLALTLLTAGCSSKAPESAPADGTGSQPASQQAAGNGSSTGQSSAPVAGAPGMSNANPESVPAGGPNPGSDGQPGEAQTTQKIKRWTGVSMANLKEPVPGIDPSFRCQISHVYKASPGDRAGAKKNDMIVAANGIPVHRFQDISQVTKGQPPGFTFTMTVLRNGKKLELPITIEAKPDDMRARLQQAWEGAQLEPFSVTAMNGANAGKEITSASLKGKVIVLDFWATWCGPCRSTMPALDKLQKELGPKGLVVLGVSSEAENDIKNFLGQNTYAYPIARDPVGDVKQDYEISNLPTMFIIDRKGVVQQVGVGTGHMPTLEATLRRLLG